VLAILVDAAVRARGGWRWAFWSLTGAMMVLFADWPGQWSGSHALVPHGLVGFFAGRHPKSEIFHLHGLQLISWNLFILAGLAIFAALVAAAAFAWRSGRNAGGAEPAGGPAG
jgi:hypothetical protein